MTDRRLLRCNGHVAHTSLQGQIEASRFVDGDLHYVASDVADLYDAIDGSRDRQMLRGEIFVALDDQESHIFGYGDKDGYVGWLQRSSLAQNPHEAPTHYVSVGPTYAKSTPALKTMGGVTPLSFGVRLIVLEDLDGWSKVIWRSRTTQQYKYVPTGHCRRLATSKQIL